MDNPTYSFTVTVVNTAPYFAPSPPIEDFFIHYNSPVKTIELDSLIKDNEGHTITLASYYTLKPGGNKTLIPNGIFTSPSPY